MVPPEPPWMHPARWPSGLGAALRPRPAAAVETRWPQGTGPGVLPDGRQLQKVTGLEVPVLREEAGSCSPRGRCSSFCCKHLAKGLPSQLQQRPAMGLSTLLTILSGGWEGVFLGRGALFSLLVASGGGG